MAINPAEWKLGTYWDDKEPHTLEQIKEAGFACIELNLDNYKAPSDTVTIDNFARYDRAVQTAKDLGLEIWSVHLPFGSLWDISDLDDAVREPALEGNIEIMDWAKGWGAEVLVIHPSFEPIPDGERAERLARASESIRLLTGEAVKQGLRLAVEDLPRTCLGNNAAEIAAMIKEAPEAAVCCDTNHLLTETPEDFIRSIGSRIRTLHVSDYDGVDERHWIPGRGIVRWGEVMRALVDNGYNGPFMFEADYENPREVVASFRAILDAYSEADLREQ
ncbi:sugar phosphate isomerase/epimerase family protein [Paenibacillus sp. VCA1]|uniref:sugar phosphate isomerase/epimerase family protein n=1 Tax=Paenibacillus sp. VCA1 TaxID=3039148 RepID=UPI002871ADAC|nr:sugar phosphate isomerase/epimerase family protein [Paenibacillus sp. VCA1]MDR9853603.1 sugar phosphate isomerase/epimerase family protein [Paenibacillus sp. VCA1]